MIEKLPVMRVFTKRMLFLIVAAAAVWMTFSSTAGAYTVEKREGDPTGKFLVSPTKHVLELYPGQTFTEDVVFSNQTGQPLEIVFSKQDFRGSTDPAEATVFLKGPENRFGAQAWLTPELERIVLGDGETLTMSVTINVPRAAESGGHYAALFAATETPIQQGGSKIDITNRVGCLFLIRVPGPVVESGTLNPPEVPGMMEFGPVDIGLVFSNLGNVHLIPEGRVTVENLLGQTVAEIPVKEWIVLPEAARRSTVTWDNKFAFGPHKVKAEIWYGSQRSELVSTSSLWMVPWRMMLGAVLAVALIVALAYKLVHRRRSVRLGFEDEIARLKRKAGEA